jgi:hypothetical protein
MFSANRLIWKGRRDSHGRETGNADDAGFP